MTSLSGDLATGGNVTKRGYDLWAKKINEMGGIEVKGKKYKIVEVMGDVDCPLDYDLKKVALDD